MTASIITTCKLVFFVCLFLKVGQADKKLHNNKDHIKRTVISPFTHTNTSETFSQSQQISEGKLKQAKSVPKGAIRRVCSNEERDFYDAKKTLPITFQNPFTIFSTKSKKNKAPVFSMPEIASKPVSDEQFFSVEEDFKDISSEESVTSNIDSPNPSFGWWDEVGQSRHSDSNLSRTFSASSFDSVVSEPSSPRAALNSPSSNLLGLASPLNQAKEQLELPKIKEYNLHNLTSLMTHLSNSEYNLKLANIESTLKDTIFYKMKKFEAEQFSNVLHHQFIKGENGWLKFYREPTSLMKNFSAKQPLLEIMHEHVVHTRQHWLDSMPNHARKSLAITILVLYAQLYVLLQENPSKEGKDGQKKINEWNEGKRKKNLAEMHERVQLAYHFYRFSKENDHLQVVEDTSKVVEEQMAELMQNSSEHIWKLDEVKKVVEFKPFIGQDFKDILEVVFQRSETGAMKFHPTFLEIINEKEDEKDIREEKVLQRFKSILQDVQNWDKGVPNAKVEDKRTRLRRIWEFIDEFIEKGVKGRTEGWIVEKNVFELHFQMVCLSERGLQRAINRVELLQDRKVSQENRYEDYKDVMKKLRTRNDAVRLATSYKDQFEKKIKLFEEQIKQAPSQQHQHKEQKGNFFTDLFAKKPKEKH